MRSSEDHTLAALRFLERFPEGCSRRWPRRPRAPSRELEVLEERDEVVLSARRAGRDREVGVLRLAATRLDLVLGGEPQTRIRSAPSGKLTTAPLMPRTKPCTTGRSSGRPSCRAAAPKREPAQNLRLADRSADLLLELRRQLVERPRCCASVSLNWNTSSLFDSAACSASGHSPAGRSTPARSR